MKWRCTTLSDEILKKRIGLLLTNAYIDALDELVEKGIYLEHQVAIREALRHLFQFHGIEPFSSELGEDVEKGQD